MKLGVERLAATPLPHSTGWLLSICGEARGKQDLWLAKRPEVLRRIRIAVLAHIEPFTVREIAGSVPDAGVPLIRYVLNELKKEGLVESSGTGKAARWRRTNRDE